MSDIQDTQSVRKKRRVKQACDYCRSKKAKCDGATPVCSTCIANSETCTYTQSSKRRGLPSGYTHDLEKKVILFQAIIAQLLNNSSDKMIETKIVKMLTEQSESRNLIQNINSLQGLWDTNAISDLFNRFIIKNKSAVHDAKSSTNSLSSLSNLQQNIQSQEESNFKHEGIKSESIQSNTTCNNLYFNSNSGALTQDYNLVNDPSFLLKDDIFQFIADEIEDSKEDWEPVTLQYHGMSSLISGFTTKSIQQYNNKLSLDEKSPFRVGSIFNVSSSAITASINNTIRLPIEIFQFPDSLRKLVDFYFQIYHSWIPMLDRISIIRQTHHLQSFSNKSTQFQASDCNLIALVWAILALGKSGSSSTSHSKLTASYAKNAIMALENSLTSTIETIQAMILLGLYYYQAGQWDYSWVLVSSGTRMAIDVRLMAPATANEDSKKDGPESNSATLDKISRERTWATVYVVNTLLSARMGRSPVVRAQDWPVPSINCNGWEEWEAWKSFHSPNTLELDSGRCLSTFNQLIKVVSVLNLALTCTIDTSEQIWTNRDIDCEDEEEEGTVGEEDKHKNNKYTLISFQRKLSKWLKELPEYCRLEYFENSSKLPPMIAYLHLTLNLTWCTLAVRLSGLRDNGEDLKEKIIKFRDSQYTKAAVGIKGIINLNSMKNLILYPFIDHFILMGFNFPKMMAFDEDETLKHCEEFRSLLINAALTSVPCRISWDLYKIMKGIVDDLFSSMSSDIGMKRTKRKNDELEENTASSKFNLPTKSPYSSLFSEKETPTSTSDLGNIITPMIPSTGSKEETKNLKESSVHLAVPSQNLNPMPFNNTQFSTSTLFGNRFNNPNQLNSNNNSTENFSKLKYSTYNQNPPKHELDLFMLDTDFASNDSRLDKFMKNLGYISYNDRNPQLDKDYIMNSPIANQFNQENNKITSTLPQSLEMQLGNEIENIGIREYLQKMAEKNS